MPLDWIVRLYPAEWRERYAGEMLAPFAQIRATPRTALDLALGAKSRNKAAACTFPAGGADPAVSGLCSQSTRKIRNF